jgi:hypothetical protein
MAKNFVIIIETLLFQIYKRRHDIQHDGTQHNGTQRNGLNSETQNK